MSASSANPPATATAILSIFKADRSLANTAIAARERRRLAQRRARRRFRAECRARHIQRYDIDVRQREQLAAIRNEWPFRPSQNQIHLGKALPTRT